MNMDLSVELMHATVQLEQPLGNGTRTVGTGFLISETAPDGRPRTVLVTANHVFKQMPGKIARIEELKVIIDIDPAVFTRFRQHAARLP